MSRTAAMLIRHKDILIVNPGGLATSYAVPDWLGWTAFVEHLNDRRAFIGAKRIAVAYTIPGIGRLQLTDRGLLAAALKMTTGLEITPVSAYEALTLYHRSVVPGDKIIIPVLIADHPNGGGNLSYCVNGLPISSMGLGRTVDDARPLSRQGEALGILVTTLLGSDQKRVAAICNATGHTPGAITLQNQAFATRCERYLGAGWENRVAIYPSPHELLLGAQQVVAGAE